MFYKDTANLNGKTPRNLTQKTGVVVYSFIMHSTSACILLSFLLDLKYTCHVPLKR